MRLFELEGNYPVIITEHLMIPEFKTIWERDKSKDKAKAKTELAYIYFMMDVKSSYLAYSEEEREIKICQDLFKKDKYKPDQVIIDAMKRYEEMSDTPSTNLLKAGRIGAEKLRKFLLTVNISERTKSGMPVYKPQEISRTIAELDKVVESLKKLEDNVRKEENSPDKVRGGTTGGLMEFDR